MLAAGACLIVGPGQVLSGNDGLGLSEEKVNVGINAQGIHLMNSGRHRCDTGRAGQCRAQQDTGRQKQAGSRVEKAIATV